jgi:hypothetical protein
MYPPQPQRGGQGSPADLTGLSTEQLTRDLITLRIGCMKEAFRDSDVLSKMASDKWASLDGARQKAAVAEFSKIQEDEFLFKYSPSFKALHEEYDRRMDADVMGTYDATTAVRKEMAKAMIQSDLDYHIIMGGTPIIGSFGTDKVMDEVLALSRPRLPGPMSMND